VSSNSDWVKPKTIKLAFASPLSTQRQRVEKYLSALGIRKMCLT